MYVATSVAGNSEGYVQIIKDELLHIMRWEVFNCFDIGQTDTRADTSATIVLMFPIVATAY